jgi:hypothetical protein
MVTTVGNETELDELVEDLVKLDFAAIEAYRRRDRAALQA